MSEEQNRENVISGLQYTIEMLLFDPATGYFKKPDDLNKADRITYDACVGAIALLKEQEVRELSMDEWREWKKNSRRDPICMLWENDTSPMWVLNPNKVHEPALLMGKLKLFTGKPTFEQCKALAKGVVYE